MLLLGLLLTVLSASVTLIIAAATSQVPRWVTGMALVGSLTCGLFLCSAAPGLLQFLAVATATAGATFAARKASLRRLTVALLTLAALVAFLLLFALIDYVLAHPLEDQITSGQLLLRAITSLWEPWRALFVPSIVSATAVGLALSLWRTSYPHDQLRPPDPSLQQTTPGRSPGCGR